MRRRHPGMYRHPTQTQNQLKKGPTIVTNELQNLLAEWEKAKAAVPAAAAVIAAGIDGIENKITPPDPINENLYDFSQEQIKEMGIETLPQNLHEALIALEQDTVLKDALGDVVDEFLKVKHMEWVEYMRHVSDWEIKSYLEFY